MIRSATALALFFAGLLLVSVPVRAHHGNAAYDEEHWVTLTGTVTEFVWSNPHVQIYMDVKDAKGGVVNWAIESQSPGILKRNGWTRDSIKPGDRISVSLTPAKDGAPVGFSGNTKGQVAFADGHVLKMDVR